MPAAPRALAHAPSPHPSGARSAGADTGSDAEKPSATTAQPATEPADRSPLRAQLERIIAEAMARLGDVAPALVPRSIRRAWAGLRTFAPDRVPVVGEDPALPGFFWLAGQGGAGIETSPALGQVAADLLVSGETTRIDAQLLTPARFAMG